MIDGTFAFVKGVGPAREKELYRKNILCWADFPATGIVLSRTLDERIREGIQEVRTLWEAGREAEVAARLPTREHWRLLPHLEAHATYLDIETAIDGRISVIGLYDAVGGPRLYVRGHNLGAYLDEPPPRLVVTFNGAAFDLPVIARTFPRWTPPALHVDMRTVLGQLREGGGLKAIETRLGIGRPLHLQGVGGADALVLWDAFRARRDVNALRRLLEYNLYDVVQLRTLAQIASERLCERCSRPWTPPVRFERGDVLADISKAVERVAAAARTIVPDAFHDEERRVLRA